jgi:hypothetical protein
LGKIKKKKIFRGNMKFKLEFKKTIKEQFFPEKIATITFIIFLFWVIFYSYYYINFYPGFNHDILLYANSNLFVDSGNTIHPIAILGNLIYKIIPLQIIVWISPFSIAGIYLSIYFFVSKKIIFWYPITIPLPLFYTTLIPSVIDWLLLPIIYNRLINGFEKQAIILSVIMVYIHGPWAFIYFPLLFIFLKKIRDLIWVIAFSIPQLIPLLYFSKGPAYISTLESMVLTISIPGFPDFEISGFSFRIFFIIIYITIFFTLLIYEKKDFKN